MLFSTWSVSVSSFFYYSLLLLLLLFCCCFMPLSEWITYQIIKMTHFIQYIFFRCSVSWLCDTKMKGKRRRKNIIKQKDGSMKILWKTRMTQFYRILIEFMCELGCWRRKTTRWELEMSNRSGMVTNSYNNNNNKRQ